MAYGWFVGIDWATAEHAVCVLDDGGAVHKQFVVPHTAAGVDELRGVLSRLGAPADLRVAIERPTGLLVDSLVEAGFMVVPIHPNVVKASRPRYSAACGKDDRRDAYILADILRTDGHRFVARQPLSAETRALRAAVRTRDDLVAQRVSMANQLREQLEGFWPGAARIFHGVDTQIALAFLAKYPSPRAASGLTERRFQGFLDRHSYTGRRPAAELLARLRAAPEGKASPAEAEVRAKLVTALVKVLQAVVSQLGEITALVKRLVEQHPDGPVVMSFPRAGRINAAQILAEIGDCRERYATDDQLAAEAGIAPVTHASGKHRDVVFRHACNKRLRRALTCFADNSRHASEWAAERYARSRASGKDHQHAVRILARAWIRVLWRCWQDRTPYDPTRHRAAARAA